MAMPEATSSGTTQFPRGSVVLHACRLFPTKKLCTSERIVRAAPPPPPSPLNHPPTPLPPPPPHCRAPNTSTRSKGPALQGSPLPMSAPTPRPTLPLRTSSPPTTTRAGRASRRRAATASRHRTAPCTAHAPHSHRLCARCATRASRPTVGRYRLHAAYGWLNTPPLCRLRAVRHVRQEGQRRRGRERPARLRLRQGALPPLTVHTPTSLAPA
eukprot:scaffold10143_cov59-Phaeocystis_antarctica.AAC.2